MIDFLLKCQKSLDFGIVPILDMLGLKSGEEIRMTVVNNKLIVEASSDPLDKLTGIIKIKQSEADKLIESEEWY